jgi:hypothetical protein
MNILLQESALLKCTKKSYNDNNNNNNNNNNNDNGKKAKVNHTLNKLSNTPRRRMREWRQSTTPDLGTRCRWSASRHAALST